jgi:inner membrane protein
MDPVTHTLVGASLAQTGLKGRTGLGTAALLIGANSPDIDALSYAWGGETALWFRRGWTHGVLALVLLPVVLTGLLLIWDRAVRRRRAAAGAPVRPLQLLLLSTIAIATHPLLDSLNVYGMRWFMPFSDRWFYADTLFIIDPWVWMVLVAGVWLASRRSHAPLVALAVVSLYVVVMAMSSVLARKRVESSLAHDGERTARVMVAPLAVTPFRRYVVVDDGRSYQVGMFSWYRRPRFGLETLPYDRRPSTPEAANALDAAAAQKFLSWARFPYFVVDPISRVLHIGDARYGLDPEESWASTRVPIPRSP